MVNLSIHPRNWVGAKGKKQNTAEPCMNNMKGILGKRLRNLQRRRQAHDITLQSLGKHINPASFRRPGSMKG